MATTDNGNREREIFEAALDIASAEGRLGYLKGACGGDAALLARVQALLRAHETAGGFLPEQPKLGATIRLVTEKAGDKIYRIVKEGVKDPLSPKLLVAEHRAIELLIAQLRAARMEAAGAR